MTQYNRLPVCNVCGEGRALLNSRKAVKALGAVVVLSSAFVMPSLIGALGIITGAWLIFFQKSYLKCDNCGAVFPA